MTFKANDIDKLDETTLVCMCMCDTCVLQKDESTVFVRVGTHSHKILDITFCGWMCSFVV